MWLTLPQVGRTRRRYARHSPACANGLEGASAHDKLTVAGGWIYLNVTIRQAWHPKSLGSSRSVPAAIGSARPARRERGIHYDPDTPEASWRGPGSGRRVGGVACHRNANMLAMRDPSAGQIHGARRRPGVLGYPLVLRRHTLVHPTVDTIGPQAWNLRRAARRRPGQGGTACLRIDITLATPPAGLRPAS